MNRHMAKTIHRNPGDCPGCFFFSFQETAQTLLLRVYSPVFALLTSVASLFLTREAGGLSQRSPLGFRSRAGDV